MTEETLNTINELKLKIEKIKRSIMVIDSLMTACGLSCKITGTPRGFKHEPEYYFENKEEIIKLLQLDKDMLINKLAKLEKTFAEY